MGRLVATCTVDGADLNREMVEDGWAIASQGYSERYVNDELRAHTAKVGLWSSDFEAPADYRRAERAENATAARSESKPVAGPPSGCPIKGNRNRRGQWIYHLPGTPYYEQTRAEEMFCTEAEAQTPGYRKSRAQ